MVAGGAIVGSILGAAFLGGLGSIGDSMTSLLGRDFGAVELADDGLFLVDFCAVTIGGNLALA